MKKTPGKLLSIVVLSLGLHLLLVYALFQSHTNKVSKGEKFSAEKSIPIQARLVFIPRISAPELPEVAKKLSEVVAKEIVVPEKTTVEERLVNSEPPALAVKQNVENMPIEQAPPPKENRQKNYSAIDYTDVSNIAQQQLSGLNQTKLQSLAQQAATEYQEQKKAPTLELKPTDPFVTEDEKLRESVQVNVNCDGNTNKVASVMSGLFSGTLKCSKPPGIDSFIQNRLNKAALINDTKNPQ